MLKIKFAPSSLLYGESYFWIVLSALAPMHLAPNFRNTRTEHAVKLMPNGAMIMNFNTRISENRMIKALLAQTFVAFQCLYLLTYVVIGIAFEGEILGIPKSETMTYKLLVQTPTAFRYGLLMLTLINTQDLNYNLWQLYDNNELFSVTRAHQARVASWCLIGVLPDALANVAETLHIVRFMRTNTILAGFWWTRFVSFWTGYVILSGLVNIMVRYKPVLNLTYTATCVSEHLEFLYSQIAATADSTIQPIKVPSTTWRWQLQSPSHRPLFLISNLYELERHLTQVQLFIGDLDRESPATILTLTSINTMTFFYAIFYASYGMDVATSSLAFLLCGARALPLVAMFVAGSRLERICRKMNDKLEMIYFQDKSDCLIYKHLAGSHLSLARALRALGDIRLTCNGLMRVDAGTLKRCAIYVGTVVLIVTQYDSIASSTTTTNSNYRPTRGGN